MGKSSGSSNTQTQMSPGQERLTNAQTDFLTNTAFPAYAQTIGTAKQTYDATATPVIQSAVNALKVAQQTGNTQQIAGTNALNTGVAGLSSLFDPKYEEEQVKSALQAGRESGRELVNTQNANFGSAGGLGSSRQALANANLGSLIEQRQTAAAADARAKVQANKALASNQLATIGGQNLGAANTSAAAQIGYTNTPQDVLAKYASILYGTPQQSTTPDFRGTQSSRTSGKSSGISL